MPLVVNMAIANKRRVGSNAACVAMGVLTSILRNMLKILLLLSSSFGANEDRIKQASLVSSSDVDSMGIGRIEARMS